MARVSHTARALPSVVVWASSISAGTLPVGLMPESDCLNVEWGANESKRTSRSSKGMPACFISTQGRMDQEEEFLLPISRV